jgi:uncharacterized membrane protein
MIEKKEELHIAQKLKTLKADLNRKIIENLDISSKLKEVQKELRENVATLKSVIEQEKTYRRRAGELETEIRYANAEADGHKMATI